MITKSKTTNKFESSEIRKNGWKRHDQYGRAKFRLTDAINVRFNSKNIAKYEMPREPFIVKCDAVDDEGTPIEIKNGYILDAEGNKIAIRFSEHLAIKSYRDAYKVICEKLKIQYKFLHGKRKRLDFSELYTRHPEIIPIAKLKLYGEKRKKAYYNQLLSFCSEHGVTDMYNNFLESEAVQNIYNNWVRNFTRKDFYLDCYNDIYHSSDLSFYVKSVRGYWGFNRMTVFVRLKKNI